MDGFGGAYKALVLGASGGIGAAFVEALRADPACTSVLGLSRRKDGLEITDEGAVEQAARRVASELGSVELVIDATGALTIDGHGPEKTIKAIDPAAMARQFAVNAIGPALLLKHIVPLMPADRAPSSPHCRPRSARSATTSSAAGSPTAPRRPL